jgi:sucrose phosphorylase
MLEKLEFIYGPETGKATYERLGQLLGKYSALAVRQPALPPNQRLSEKDVILITYGDQVQDRDKATTHLQTLHRWLTNRLKGIVNTVHILPFYPYTSDDGFSVVDYWQVDPNLGTWDDINALHADFRLMFDAVVNHISASSAWFQGFLQGEAPYTGYFLPTDPSFDLSGVTRPRALPLLTRFQTPQGEKYLWTTFSEDQLDINFGNPEVFLKIAELLLFYVSQGADLIRLDAIGYMWKEIGTSCIHLPQTHAIIQVWREMFDKCAPNTLLITETNVPHRDNVSYFGNGRNEAQMVYQFTLPPLTLHALLTGNAHYLKEWAASLEKVSDSSTFFNFLSSHDGIGVVPARNILNDTEVNFLLQTVEKHGGKVSYKNNPDGSQSPYELNITYFDALSDSQDETEPDDLKIKRFLVSQAIMLCLQGVPGIYFHSLLGSHNWQAGFEQTGRNRTLNREKLDFARLEEALDDLTSHTAQVFTSYTELIRQRIARPAFHPNAGQEIIRRTDDTLFVVVRTAVNGQEQVLAVNNVWNNPQNLQGKFEGFGLSPYHTLLDVLSGQTYTADETGQLNLTVAPYQVMWLLSSQ